MIGTKYGNVVQDKLPHRFLYGGFSYIGTWVKLLLRSFLSLTTVQVLLPGLTKPGEVGDFFALVSTKSPNFCQKAKF